MKIREVCDKTGLTERAVRLYLEKGLLCPRSEWRQGRTYTEYRESDVKRLREIAALRSVGFSLEEIGSMYQNGANISVFLEKRIEALQSESENAAENQALLLRLAKQSWQDGGSLGQAILREGKPGSIVDCTFDFGRADGLTREEKQELGKKARRRLDLSERRRKLLTRAVILAAAVLILAGAAGWLLYERSAQVFTMHTAFIPDEGILLSEPFLVEGDSGGGTELAACITMPGEEKSFLGVFRDAEGEMLCRSLFPGMLYALIQLQVDIPRREAREMGLLNGERLDAERVLKALLTDDAFCCRYLTVTGLQAVPSQGSMETIRIPQD